jgi:hypothetical protein
MSQRAKIFLPLGAGFVCLLLAATALVELQVCVTQNFWLHVVAFPINPRTVTRPTAFTYVGAACEIAFPVFLTGGSVLIMIGGYYSIRRFGAGGRRNGTEDAVGNGAADSPSISPGRFRRAV